MSEYYFFYCIKEKCDDLLENVLFKDVLKIQEDDEKEARKKAKSIIFNKHPEIPKSFRKTTGKYFYLTKTDKYQYIEIDNFECKLCGKKHNYKGIKNSYIQEGFCSFECKKRYLQIKKQIFENELIKYLDEDNQNINNFISYHSSNQIGYIYLITNKVTNKVYVGQTTQEPVFRWWQHLKNKEKFDRKSICDLKFEVIEKIDIGKQDYSELKRVLFEKEDYYIHKYNSLKPNGYNEINARSRKERLSTAILSINNEILETEL